MNTRRTAFLFLVALVSGWAWAAPLPSLTLTRLDGRSITLPQSGEALTVLVVGFSRRAGGLVDAWADRFDRDFGADPSVAIYRVAVLSGVPALFRHLVLGSIKSSVPSEYRSRFLTTFRDGRAWKLIVGFHERDEPYVLLVDRRGRVAATISQAFDRRRYDVLAAAARSLLARSRSTGK